jgi:hypothetical protein
MSDRQRTLYRRVGLIAALLGTTSCDVRGQSGAPGGTVRGDWRTDFSRHTVPLEEIVSGGPPKDGIPAIDRPQFVSVRDADAWLDSREPVIVVQHAGNARAYPYQILLWHEIVNDQIGDVPVAVTYCPLCNTALVFDRRVAGQVLDFGTTGRLRHSDLVMYDRQTESWWQQATGEGIVGTLAGSVLTLFPAQTLPWREFKETHPDGKVLSRRTGHDRPYGRNPYVGYDDPGGRPISRFFRGRRDERLPAMERVAAVGVGDEFAAYPFSSLSKERVVNDALGVVPIVVLWSPGTASALDASAISEGRDVGTSGVFRRHVDGRTLTFRTIGDAFEDRETRSRWTLDGRAVAGPMRGVRLTPVPHGDYFWFAWAAFRPRHQGLAAVSGTARE